MSSQAGHHIWWDQVQASELVQIQYSDCGQSSCLCSAAEQPWWQHSLLNWLFVSSPFLVMYHVRETSLQLPVCKFNPDSKPTLTAKVWVQCILLTWPWMHILWSKASKQHYHIIFRRPIQGPDLSSLYKGISKSFQIES